MATQLNSDTRRRDNLTIETPLVSVVMPCLNEAQTVAGCIREAWAGLAAGDFCGEIIIADNGSEDGSAAIAESEGARVVQIAERGYGNALRGGFAAAQGKYIIMGDCDGSYDFGEIPRFVAKLEEGYELVMGNRFAGGIMPGAMPWHHRYIGNPVLSGIGRILFRPGCKDFHCGLRGIARASLSSVSLESSGMEFASEMVVAYARRGNTIAEIPITLRPDGRNRSPHLRSFADGIRHLCLISREFLNTKFRMKALGLVLVAAILAGVLAVWNGVTPGSSHSIPPVVFDVESIDLGVIPVGSDHKVAFQVYNNSNRPLYPKRLRLDCGCVRVLDLPDSIAPKACAQLVVTYHPRGEPADVKRVSILECEQDGQVFQKAFELISKTRSPLAIEGFENRKSIPITNGVTSFAFQVQGHFGEDLARLAIEAKPDWLHIEKVDQARSASGSADKGTTFKQTFMLTVDASGLSSGSHAGKIVASTGHAETDLEIVFVKRNRVEMSPDVIFLSNTENESWHELTATMVGLPAFSKLEVEPVPELASVVGHEFFEGGRIRFFLKGTVDRAYRGYIRIREVGLPNFEDRFPVVVVKDEL